MPRRATVAPASRPEIPEGFVPQQAEVVFIVENPEPNPLVIPHGQPGVEVDDLILPGLARFELKDPDIWKTSRNFQRQLSIGKVTLRRGTYEELLPPPPLPDNVLDKLESIDLAKAWLMVVSPNVSEQLGIINVVPSDPNQPNTLTPNGKEWLKNNHMWKLEAAKIYATYPEVQALADRQGRDLSVLVRACDARIRSIKDL